MTVSTLELYIIPYFPLLGDLFPDLVALPSLVHLNLALALALRCLEYHFLGLLLGDFLLFQSRLEGLDLLWQRGGGEGNAGGVLKSS